MCKILKQLKKIIVIILIIILISFICSNVCFGAIGGGVVALDDNNKIVAWKQLDNANIVLANGQIMTNISTKREVNKKEKEVEIELGVDGNVSIVIIVDYSVNDKEAFQNLSNAVIDISNKLGKELENNGYKLKIGILLIACGEYVPVQQYRMQNFDDPSKSIKEQEREAKERQEKMQEEKKEKIEEEMKKNGLEWAISESTVKVMSNLEDYRKGIDNMMNFLEFREQYLIQNGTQDEETALKLAVSMLKEDTEEKAKKYVIHISDGALCCNDARSTITENGTTYIHRDTAYWTTYERREKLVSELFNDKKICLLTLLHHNKGWINQGAYDRPPESPYNTLSSGGFKGFDYTYGGLANAVWIDKDKDIYGNTFEALASFVTGEMVQWYDEGEEIVEKNGFFETEDSYMAILDEELAHGATFTADYSIHIKTTELLSKIEITDYIPDGYQLISTEPVGQYNFNDNTAKFTIENPDYVEEYVIKLRLSKVISSSADVEDLENKARVTATTSKGETFPTQSDGTDDEGKMLYSKKLSILPPFGADKPQVSLGINWILLIFMLIAGIIVYMKG